MQLLFNLENFLLGLILSGGLVLNYAHGSEGFTFYTYHKKPPYTFVGQTQQSHTLEQKGLYQAYVDYLNVHLDGLQIKLKFIPRLRLESQLRSGELDGAIIGVNPLWFNDKDEVDYLWSAAFMQDQDVIVVRAGGAFPYGKPVDLVGRLLALPRGGYFWGVSELIAAGKIQVFETNTERQNLEMLALGRVHGTIMSILSAHYFFNHELKHSKFEILNTPHDTFARRVLFPQYLKARYQQLAAIIKESLNDPLWLEELARWHNPQRLQRRNK